MRKRILTEDVIFEAKKKLYFDSLYSLLKQEGLTRDQIGEIGNKVSTYIVGLIDKSNG